MSDSDSQEDELLALASIYSDNILSLEKMDGAIHGSRNGVFLAAPEPPAGFQLKTMESEELYPVRFLSPITLSFRLPRNYPSSAAPEYIISCVWLDDTQISVLCSELDRQWKDNEGSVILFTWMSFLQNSVLDFLSLTTPLLLVSPTLLQELLRYNTQQSEMQFAGTLYSCLVCFRDRPGAASLRFTECAHVFCRDCMREYFETKIAEGAVRNMNCPFDKCETQATSVQVRELVSPGSYEKYDQMLLQLSFDTMQNIVYCPRKSCTYPVELEPDSTLGRCPSCQFTFCIYCKRVYHYPSPCAITGNFIELRDAYVGGSESEKRALEKRYGKKRIEDLIESSYTQEWIDAHSKKCPSCKASIQKIDGCNKMTCSKCHSYFCWLCLDTLPRLSPYQHYNNSQSRCYDKLFQGIDQQQNEIDDDDDNI